MVAFQFSLISRLVFIAIECISRHWFPMNRLLLAESPNIRVKRTTQTNDSHTVNCYSMRSIWFTTIICISRVYLCSDYKAAFRIFEFFSFLAFQQCYIDSMFHVIFIAYDMFQRLYNKCIYVLPSLHMQKAICLPVSNK